MATFPWCRPPVFMRVICALAVGLAMALAFQVAATPTGNPGEGWQKILRFYGFDGTISRQLVRTIHEQTSNEPAVRQYALEALADQQYVERAIGLLAQRMSMRLSPETLRQHQVFAESPAGHELARLFRENPDPRHLSSVVLNAPPPYGDQIRAFDSSPAMTQFAEFLGSAEALQVASELGKDVMCRHIASDRPLDHEVMLALHICVDGTDAVRTPGPPQGGSAMAVVRLYFDGEQLRKAMLRDFAQVDDPVLAGLSQRALAEDFDSTEIIARIGSRLEASIPHADFASIVAFSQTATGRELARIAASTEPALFIETLDRQPEDFLRRLRLLEHSEAWTRVSNQLVGPATTGTLVDYFKELVCARARREDATLFRELVSSGRCPAVGN